MIAENSRTNHEEHKALVPLGGHEDFFIYFFTFVFFVPFVVQSLRGSFHSR